MEKLFNFLNSIPYDKALHALSGVFIFAILHFWMSFFVPVHISLVFAIVSVVAIAVVKELYDGMHPDIHTKDWYDAVATTSGGMLGLLCVLPGLLKSSYLI